MKLKLLTALLLIFSICNTNAQTKSKKGTSTKKSVKKTIVKTEAKDEPEIVDKLIVEEAPESNPLKVKYRRSSLYTMMVETPNMPYADSIRKYFVTSRIPDKFNNHNLDKRVLDRLPSNIPTSSSTPSPSQGLIGGTPASSNAFASVLMSTQTPYMLEYLAERKRLEDEAKEIGVTKKKKYQNTQTKESHLTTLNIKKNLKI